MRKGAAILLVLICYGITAMALFFVLDTVVFQAYLVRNRQKSIQENFDAKDEHLERVYYSYVYMPKIFDTIPTAIRIINRIKTFEVINSKGEKIKGEIDLTYNTDEISYKCTLGTIGSTRKTILQGRLLNEFITDGIIKEKITLLNHLSVDMDKLHLMKEYFENIPSELKLEKGSYLGNVLYITDGEQLIVTDTNFSTSFELIREDGKIQSLSRNTSILVLSHNDEKTDLVIDFANTSSNRLTGLIYIENGDLIIKKSCYLNSLIVLGNGRIVVDGNFTPSIRGMIISNDQVDYSSKLSLEYNGEIILTHGYLLPDFVKPTIDSISFR